MRLNQALTRCSCASGPLPPTVACSANASGIITLLIVGAETGEGGKVPMLKILTHAHLRGLWNQVLVHGEGLNIVGRAMDPFGIEGRSGGGLRLRTPHEFAQRTVLHHERGWACALQCLPADQRADRRQRTERLCATPLVDDLDLAAHPI